VVGSTVAAVRPFRFSVQCSSPVGVDARGWRELARRCEGLGYSTLTVSDHLDEQLGPVAALMAAALATTTLRVGAMVFCNDFRHPVALAKEAATIDVMSEGRFEFGLGAGWLRTDYDRAGITLDAAGLRIARLAEALAVVKGLWAGEKFSFAGAHYVVDGLVGTPTPRQRPHPPVFIGGGGERMLSLAGREADIVGLNPTMATGAIDASLGADATAAATERKLGWVRAAAGDRFDKLDVQTRVHLALVTDTRDEVAELFAGGFGLTPSEAKSSPHALVGTVDQIVDDLLARRERFGINVVGLPIDAMDAFAPVVARLAGA
jgi:probable F420-dependent oxidoreductase